MFIPNYVLGVRCHLSPVTCHVSPTTCKKKIYIKKILNKKLDKVVELVGVGAGINGAYPV